MRSLSFVVTRWRRCVPDALTDGFEATGNVVVQSEALKAANAGQGILNNGGRDDLIRGNLCVGWETCISSCDVSRSSSCSPLLPCSRGALAAACVSRSVRPRSNADCACVSAG